MAEEREELAKLIHMKTSFGFDAQPLADAILAAGWTRTEGWLPGQAEMKLLREIAARDGVPTAEPDPAASKESA